MCAPVALGVASFATGALGAVGNYQSASAQASAQNAAAANNYKYQLQVRRRNWDNTKHVYGRKLFQYDQQLDENSLAAARAYSKAQLNLNEQYRQAAFRSEGNIAKLLRSQGNFAAAGRTGRSADRLNAEQLMQYGRGQAAIAENLMTARNKYFDNTMDTNRELLSANRRAYEKVAIRPMPTVAPAPPTMMPGPSGLSLAGGLLSAGMSGFNTYDSLTPGGAFGQRVD